MAKKKQRKATDKELLAAVKKFQDYTKLDFILFNRLITECVLVTYGLGGGDTHAKGFWTHVSMENIHHTPASGWWFEVPGQFEFGYTYKRYYFDELGKSWWLEDNPSLEKSKEYKWRKFDEVSLTNIKK